MFLLRRKKSARDGSDDKLADYFQQLKKVNVGIHEELVAGGRRSHRWNIVAAVIGGLTLLATLIGVGLTLQVRSGVDELGDLDAQETVDLLRLGMTQDELASLFGVPPAVDQVLPDQSEIAGGTVRRVVFSASDKDIVVTALVDGFNAVQFLAVTSLAPDLHLTYPPSNSGTYAIIDFHGNAAGRFRTGETTLGELAAGCMDAYNGSGAGTPWGYLAIGCNAYGYNNFDVNIVAINFHGAGTSQAGLQHTDIAQQLASAQLHPDVTSLTFNTFAWSEGYFLSGDDPSAGHLFEGFVATFEVGPLRGEPVHQD